MTTDEKNRLKVLYLGCKYCAKILKSHEIDNLLRQLNDVKVFMPVITYDKNDPHPFLGDIVGIIKGETENISYNPHIQDRVGGYLVIQTFVSLDIYNTYYPARDYLEIPFTEVMSIAEQMGKDINITIKVSNVGQSRPYNKGEVPIAPSTFQRIRDVALN